jgi:predicted aspartyl protease
MTTRAKKILLWAGVPVALLTAAAIAHPGHIPFMAPRAEFAPQQAAIPIELFRGSRIFFSGAVNGHQTQMMFDSGAGVTVVDAAFADKIGLKGGIPTSVKGTGGDTPARVVSGVTLTAGALRLSNLSVFVMDMSPVAKAIGHDMPVVIGHDALKAGIVSFDFPNRTMRFSSRDGFKAPAKAVRIDVADKEGQTVAEVSVAGLPPVETHIDLGNSGTIVLAKDYWSAQPTIANLRHAASQTGGVGGMASSRRVTLPEVNFAGMRLTNVPAGLNEDAKTLPIRGANIGIGLLKSFVVTFDVGGGALYLEGTESAPVIERERAGVRMELAGDRLHVAYVSPDGPAGAAGLKVGDQVVAIDGVPVDGKFYDRPDWTRGEAGKVVTLTRADGSNVKVTLADYF